MNSPDFYNDDEGRGSMVLAAVLVAALIAVIFGLILLFAFR